MKREELPYSEHCLRAFTEDRASSDPWIQQLRAKHRIDREQWEAEDLIRDPDIAPARALSLKRHIDQLNQRRTDAVEQIDDRIRDILGPIVARKEAGRRTETPAWATDRLSILCLKIHFMNLECQRIDASKDHIARCQEKHTELLAQRQELCLALDELLRDLAEGHVILHSYRQHKMYNDPELNPVLRKSRS